MFAPKVKRIQNGRLALPDRTDLAEMGLWSLCCKQREPEDTGGGLSIARGHREVTLFS